MRARASETLLNMTAASSGHLISICFQVLSSSVLIFLPVYF